MKTNNGLLQSTETTLQDTTIPDTTIPDTIINEFKEFISDKHFPCVAARAAVTKNEVQYFVAEHMACPKDDFAILNFLYKFVDDYRVSKSQFNSAVIIFNGPEEVDEKIFDSLLWKRLQSLSDMDSKNYKYDKRVDFNPDSPSFSFSLKEEAFFVVGLNPGSLRNSRKFKHPVIVFNPHAQFEKLREENRYEKMKNIVRKRDIEYSGSINPVLKDFGEKSEVYQYSGVRHDKDWKCPLNINHQK